MTLIALIKTYGYVVIHVGFIPISPPGANAKVRVRKQEKTPQAHDNS